MDLTVSSKDHVEIVGFHDHFGGKPNKFYSQLQGRDIRKLHMAHQLAATIFLINL